MLEPDPIFKEMNAVSPALRAFFNTTVGGMERKPYRKWSRLWAEPDDPTCADAFDPSSTVAWHERPGTCQCHLAALRAAPARCARSFFHFLSFVET